MIHTLWVMTNSFLLNMAHRNRLYHIISLLNIVISIATGWWFGSFYMFPYIRNVIIPFDCHILQRGRYILQRGRYTTNQAMSNYQRVTPYKWW